MPKVVQGPNGENIYPISVLIPASLYEKLYQGAKGAGLSFNEYIYRILRDYIYSDNAEKQEEKTWS